MSTEEQKKQPAGESSTIKVGRRAFLKVTIALSAFLAVGGVGAILKSITNPASSSGSHAGANMFPRFKVTNLSELQVNQPITFNYPLDNEPNILVKLGEQAAGGVGPSGDIVAFSQICQHLGCIYAFQAAGTSPSCNPSYKTDRPVGYCCCHGSVYDLKNGAAVISGPSPRPQPSVVLQIDSRGDVYAVGMNPPAIFGHNTGSNDVASDLQGGNPV